MERQSGIQTGSTGTAPGSGTGYAAGFGTPSAGTDTSTGNRPETAREAADQVMHFAKAQASARLGSQIDTVCQSLGSTASAVRSMGAQMREQDMGNFAGYAEQAASQLENVTQFLEGKDLDDLVVETERFARNQPAVFIGGAFLLGFLASRFLKASTPTPEHMDYERYRTQMYRAESYRPAYYNAPRPMYNPSTQPAHYGSPQGAYAGSQTTGRYQGTTSGTPGEMASRGSSSLSPNSGTGLSGSGSTGSVSPRAGSSISPTGTSTIGTGMTGTGTTASGMPGAGTTGTGMTGTGTTGTGMSGAGKPTGQGSTTPGTNQGTGGV